MARQTKRRAKVKGKAPQRDRAFVASAPAHHELKNQNVHVFVDDQNLFYGITNYEGDRSYRIEFGDLMRVAAKSTETGSARAVASAYIAGVVPDDDSFWQAAKDKGFEVFRGFLGSGRRSKQDDAYLVAQLVENLYEFEGPSTIVLVAGDADYGPALEKCLAKGWRVEIAFVAHSNLISQSLSHLCHEFREFTSEQIRRLV